MDMIFFFCYGLAVEAAAREKRKRKEEEKNRSLRKIEK